MTKSNIEDLTGRVFGELTVVKRVRDNKGKLQWLCRCSCGTEVLKGNSILLKNKTKSCINCTHKYIPKIGNVEDLSGITFGFLTVLAQAPRDENNSILWICRCACGNKIIATKSKLKSSKNNSCGCEIIRKKELKEQLKLEIAQAREEKQNLLGRVFNAFTVLEKTGVMKNGKTAWLCRCKCGTEKIIEGTALKSGNIKSCGCTRLRPLPIGKIFGKLTTLKEIEPNFTPSGRKVRKVLCRCACGTEKIIDWRKLPSRVSDCGCVNKQKIEQTKLITLGDTLKGWTVLKMEPKSTWLCKCKDCGSGSIFSTKDLKNKRVLKCICKTKIKAPIISHVGEVFGNLLLVSKHKQSYKCHCYLCDNYTTITYTRLLEGKVTDCGCTKIVTRKTKYSDKDFVGKIFGRLTVITRCAYRYKPRTKGNTSRLYWYCLCSCGKSKIVTSNNLLNKNNRSCGCLRFEISYQGRYNPNRKGKRDVLRTTKVYKMWRNTVLKRDKHTCHICNIKKSTMVVHHLLSFSRYKKHRYDPNNGITLCRKCHDEFHNKYTSIIFTPEDYIKFYKYKNQGNK